MKRRNFFKTVFGGVAAAAGASKLAAGEKSPVVTLYQPDVYQDPLYACASGSLNQSLAPPIHPMCRCEPIPMGCREWIQTVKLKKGMSL